MNNIATKPITGFFCAVLLLLLLEAGAAMLLVSSVGSADDAPALPRMTRLSDLQGTFSDLSGQSFALTDLRGKVVVINLWATWCPPCRAEMPFLEGLWKKFQDNDQVRVLCISKETLAEVRQDPLAKSLTMPLYVFTSPVPPELDPEGLPTTYIFNRQGKVVFAHTGIAQWDAPEIVAYLEALAKATSN
jgi:thiol-disulfide isomerase/thioredoxin